MTEISNKFLRMLAKQLRETAVRIEEGNSNMTQDELESAIATLQNAANKQKRLSKVQAADYLKVSPRTLDNYIAQGKIPKGIKQIGFKELFWEQKDLDAFKAEQ